MAEIILQPEDAERFWSLVRKGGPDECWLWTGADNGNGYGKFIRHRRAIFAHRLAWCLTNGPIGFRILVCHHCDNPPCCNPRHLFLGTWKDNARDMVEKGRNFVAHGELCGAAKLTRNKVAAIRTLAAAGWSTRKIAAVFDIGKTAAWRAATERGWRVSMPSKRGRSSRDPDNPKQPGQ